jgi:putative redox protein
MAESRAEPGSPAPETAVDVDAGSWVTARAGASGFRTEIDARGHLFVADEPRAVGGTDVGATPYEYLLAALAACTAMTARMYADRKGWPLEGVEVRLRTSRSHEKDCEQCETQQVGITRIERKLELTGSLTDEQRARILAIADRCPVKQTLARGIEVVNAS